MAPRADREAQGFNETVICPLEQPELEKQYREFAYLVSGKMPLQESRLPSDQVVEGAFALYTRAYLPYEILSWGGDLRVLFPESCRRLMERGIDLARFVNFWFEGPSVSHEPYNFFLLKLCSFVDFVKQNMPNQMDTSMREVTDMRRAYQDSSSQVGVA